MVEVVGVMVGISGEEQLMVWLAQLADSPAVAALPFAVAVSTPALYKVLAATGNVCVVADDKAPEVPIRYPSR